jgi:hemin uptake protein HemP
MDPTSKPLSLSERGPSIPRIDSSTLLSSGREVILVHNEQEYRLRITSNDKLILTK